MTAINVGEMNGYLYVGDIKKSYYAIVEENIENEDLEAIILKLQITSEDIFGNGNEGQNEDNQDDNKNNNTNNEETNNKVTDKDNNTNTNTNTNINNTNKNESSSDIPKTGINDTIFLLIITFIILIFATAQRLNNYKNIK